MVDSRLIRLLRVAGYRAFAGYGTFSKGEKRYRIDTEHAMSIRLLRDREGGRECVLV